MIGLPWLYALAGAMFAGIAVLSARDASNPRRAGNVAFWGLLAASFLIGGQIGDFANGCLVLGLVALAGTGALGRCKPPTTGPAERMALAARLGNRLFLPALVIPASALIGTLLFRHVALFDPKQVTLLSLGLGVLIALGVCHAWLRPPALAAVEEGRRLLDSVGWAAVLPQMLAALGAVFALAGVGDVLGGIATRLLPAGSLLAAVVAFAGGMAVLTMILGNAFAAFPVIMAAIGLPILVRGHHGDPAVIAAVGMLAGFCGTLMTPMAANFNIVPAALLELRDRNAVIRAQIGTALPLLIANIVIIYLAGFR